MLVFDQGSTATMFGVSLASMLASLSIIITFLVFRKHMQTKKAMVLYLYMFGCHLMTSASMMAGSPLNGSNECWYQGIVSNWFTMAAIMWTILVLLLLHSNIAYPKPLDISRYHHALCWGLPTLLTFLPLSNSSYGASHGSGLCRVIGPSQIAWMWIGYYGVIYTCILTAGIISVCFFVQLYSTVQLRQTVNKFKSAFFVVAAYPVVFLFCWLPSTIADMLSVLHPEAPLSLQAINVTTGLACSTGLISAIVFWVTNEPVRVMWSQAIRRMLGLASDDDSQRGLFRSSSLSVLSQRVFNPNGGKLMSPMGSSKENNPPKAPGQTTKPNFSVISLDDEVLKPSWFSRKDPAFVVPVDCEAPVTSTTGNSQRSVSQKSVTTRSHAQQPGRTEASTRIKPSSAVVSSAGASSQVSIQDDNSEDCKGSDDNVTDLTAAAGGGGGGCTLGARQTAYLFAGDNHNHVINATAAAAGGSGQPTYLFADEIEDLEHGPISTTVTL